MLFVSPVTPARTGNGLAMRAGRVLRALGERSLISLLVVPLYPGDPVLDEDLRACCTAVRVAQPEQFEGEPALPKPYDGMSFDLVHVFRLAALPFARPYLDEDVPWQLDLDDLESRTHGRIAAVARENGHDDVADAELDAAQESARLETDVLGLARRVYVCSEQDRQALAGRGRAEVVVLPNAVPIQGPLPAPPRDGPFTFLFIGTLGYYPNLDGVSWWCREVLPWLRQAAPAPFRLLVVGAGGGDVYDAVDGAEEVEVIGAVPEVGPWYERAHAVVVPIRAGGGTRIKVLESFSHRRPVVSTTIGAEGIATVSEEHLLVADAPETFADQCARLMRDPELRGRLTEAAIGLLVRLAEAPMFPCERAGGPASGAEGPTR